MNTETNHRESQRHANNSGEVNSMMSMGNLYSTHIWASLAERASLLRVGVGAASHYEPWTDLELRVSATAS